MSKRRSLVTGVKPPTVPPEVEQAFVQGKAVKAAKAKSTPKPSESQTETVTAGTPTPAPTKAVPEAKREQLTTRIRRDLAMALKRVSLERQLAGIEPYTVQEMLDAVLEPWLREQGYLP